MKTNKLFLNFLITLNIFLIPQIAQAARILEINGEASIKRKDTSNFSPVHQGMIIELGDQLKLTEDAIVKVRCADKKLKSALPGTISGLNNICPGGRSTDPRIGSIFAELLAGSYEYKTEIMSDQPQFIWPSITGIDSYQVKIQVGEQVIWEKLVNDTQVIYDGDAFRPKVPYKLLVTATNSPSPIYQLRLSRVPSIVEEAIQKEVEAINDETLGEEAKALMLIDVYTNQNHQLFLKAANILESLVKQDSTTPIIHRLLGDMYLYLGRTEAAKTQYLQALKLAKLVNNLEEVAASQSGLAHVAVVNEDLREAESLLLQAEENYRLSGKMSDAELVKQWKLAVNSKS